MLGEVKSTLGKKQIRPGDDYKLEMRKRDIYDNSGSDRKIW